MTMVSTDPIVPRALDLRALVAKRSHFLFGPRQTGKTFLVRLS
jgi:predicted AAA+ superfamily ATPase